MDVLCAVAVFLLITAGAGLALRHAYSPARYPGTPRQSRAGTRAPRGRASAQRRKSWLVTAAKSAGVKLSSDHLHGATAELAGRFAGATARAARRVARRGGQRLTAVAARRWERRNQADRQPLMISRRRPGPPHAEPEGAGEAADISVILSRAGVTVDDLRAGRGWDKLSPVDARTAAIYLTRDDGPGGRIRPEDATWWRAYRAATARPGPPPAAGNDTPAAPAPPAPAGSTSAAPGGDGPTAGAGADTPAGGERPGSAEGHDRPADATGSGSWLDQCDADEADLAARNRNLASLEPERHEIPRSLEADVLGRPPQDLTREQHATWDRAEHAAAAAGLLLEDLDPDARRDVLDQAAAAAADPGPWQAKLARLRRLYVPRVRIRRRRSGQPAADPPPPPTADASPPPAPASTAAAAPDPAATTPTAPAGARKENPIMRRYAINLEPPSTDAEFLESCVQLGDVLKALAEEVADWAEGLSGLHLPQSVLAPLHLVSEGIEEAATGAADSAKAFEDEFEDARDVASRGMHFTGEDAA